MRQTVRAEVQVLFYRIINLEFFCLFRHLVQDLSFHRHTSPVVLKKRMLTYKGRGWVYPHRLSLHIHRRVVVSGYGFPITPGASVSSG
ncbi:MAG: hypothetical protein A2Y48_07510 [Nitrospirae bacterium RIFCSPLOW2_12_42_9]|nr:MAG: hypothetical protein A2Y48_07510 [Nitrospirae bacterium RIFCSPLOW2_12_42_9]